MQQECAVYVQNVSKSYGKTHALKEINVSIQKSEIFGIIGPDGAGKTTLFRILATLLLPNSGQAFVEGLNTNADYKKIRRIIGYMPGKFSLYQDLSVEENLHFFATMFNTSVSENYETVKDIYIQLEPFKTRKAGALSGGMKQKLALCCALIHKPHVLFLDEPTTGVDPVSRKEFWHMLLNLKKKGITIVVSTPYMDEAELCDRIALIQNGRFLTVSTPQNIVDSFTLPILHVRSGNMFQLLNDLRQFDLVESAYSFGEFHHAVLKKNTHITEPFIMDFALKLQQKNHTKIEIMRSKPIIEDCFLQLSKNELGGIL